ncbi:MAG TPA: hypothetical protein VH951_08065 [Dehalococcoidia bacterium]|jgi:hypothetical protein
MARLLSVDRIAPELKASWPNRIALLFMALLIAGLAGGAMYLGHYLDIHRAGISQVEYHSDEVFGTAPGARLFYYPETHEVVMRGWILGSLQDGNTYEIWAGRRGAFTWLGTGNADDFIGFSFVGQGLMGGVDTVLITVEPPGSDHRAPTAPPLVTLIR